MSPYATIRLGSFRDADVRRGLSIPRRSFRICNRYSVRLLRINPKQPILAQTNGSSKKRDLTLVEKPRYRKMVLTSTELEVAFDGNLSRPPLVNRDTLDS